MTLTIACSARAIPLLCRGGVEHGFPFVDVVVPEMQAVAQPQRMQVCRYGMEIWFLDV